MTWDGVDKRKAVEHYAQQLEWARDKKDAERWHWWKEHCVAAELKHGSFKLSIYLRTNDESQMDVEVDAALAKERAR